jgi:hypothetical protein
MQLIGDFTRAFGKMFKKIVIKARRFLSAIEMKCLWPPSFTIVSKVFFKQRKERMKPSFHIALSFSSSNVLADP